MVPAIWRYDDHGVEREYTHKDQDGMTAMVPEYDPLMEDWAGRHTHNRPDTEIGHYQVFPVDQHTWDKMDAVTYIKSELAKQSGQFWEEVDHYKTGALECYNKHGNPDSHNRCIDFLDDSKRIGPKVPPKFQSYLCHMCPYMQTYLVQEARQEAGLYDPKSAAVQVSQRRQRRR